jgi:hypothetical protein
VIHYELVNNINSKPVIGKLFDTRGEIKPAEKPENRVTPAFCLKYGSKLKPGARFCPACGNKL